MNEISIILNKRENKFGYIISLKELTVSQLNRIKTTNVQFKHFMNNSIFIFNDDSYVVIETNN